MTDDPIREELDAMVSAWGERHDLDPDKSTLPWEAVALDLLRQLRELEWQPIETAPKDEACLWWVRPLTRMEADSLGLFWDGEFVIRGNPRFHWGKRGSWSACETAEKWMPLPAPPKEEDEHE